MANLAGTAVLALAAVVSLSGCGTVRNLDPEWGSREVYGGVRKDATEFRNVSAGYIPWSSYNRKGYRWLTPAEETTLMAGFAADMPLSAIADTLTLPLTVYAEWKRRATAESGQD